MLRCRTQGQRPTAPTRALLSTPDVGPSADVRAGTNFCRRRAKPRGSRPAFAVCGSPRRGALMTPPPRWMPSPAHGPRLISASGRARRARRDDGRCSSRATRRSQTCVVCDVPQPDDRPAARGNDMQAGLPQLLRPASCRCGPDAAGRARPAETSSERPIASGVSTTSRVPLPITGLFERGHQGPTGQRS